MKTKNWYDYLEFKDWLFDGSPMRKADLALWNDLDWSKAYMDMGPSPTGNPGPYWHVPRKVEDTVHRLYPKLVTTRWLPVLRRIAEESGRKT